MKKILSLVLALLMTFSAASFVGAAGEAAIAADTTATTTAAATGIHDEAIAFLESYGIYKGTSTTSFEPDAYSDIQRYQMALFVARVSTGWVDDSQWAVYQEWNDGIENRSTFDDLGGTYAEKVFGAISYAAQKGIIEGYGNNKFGPTDGITYQDALTMVVRTLGYKGLAWPWGYIEKAVTLDLTRGIPSTVAYTDILNRGQVAQIIYNALFATTKEGDTLAARNFGGELGWANIIITAVGKAAITADEKIVATYNGNGKAIDAGIIAFRVVNDDGTLGERYLVKNAQSFNYEKHLERYLGHAYNALFTKDEDSEYATLIGYKDLFVETVWNFGLPTKVDGEYPIQTYVKDFSLVTKFSRDDYLNKWNGDYGWKEFIMKNSYQGTIVDDYANKYGVNWTTGDILQRDANGTIVDENGDKWSTAWNYNSILNVYFETLYKVVDGKAEVIGINILDEAEIKDMIENNKVKTGDHLVFKGLTTILNKNILKTAYASLDTYVLGPKTTPNYGIFEEYRFGQIELLDEIDHNGHKKSGFTIYNLNGITEQIWKGFTKEDFPSLSKSAMKSTYVAATVWDDQCDHEKSFSWYSEDSLVPQADVKSFDYIIYSYDFGTGELKVVKKIYSADDAKADKDNFYATGVVRAYNVNAKTVTIGDNTYSYDYPELAGNGLDKLGLYDGDGSLLSKAAYTYLFKALFNQYVQYVIVDGKLTYIRLSGTEHELIVVDSYAGLSSDGYIVINGYKTDDLTYTQFRIGSYNGWVKGDYYYYPGQAAVDAAFMRGTIYKIASHNGKEDVYYVNTVALRYKNGDNYMTYDFDALKDAGVSGESYKITFQDGYKRASVYDQVNKKWVDKDWEKAGSSDKYVLICNPVGTLGATHGLAGDYAPIIVYTGKADDGWFAQGYRIIDTDATVLINVDFSAVRGFNRDQYDLTYVVFLTYDYETANYDGYDKTNLLHEDWYLLGASEYTARVFDLYTGNIVTKYATNKDLKKGYAYPAVGEWIVMDNRYDARDLNVAIPAAYLSNVGGGLYNLNDQYLFGSGFVGAVGVDTLFSKDLTSKNILSPKLDDLSIRVKGLTGDPAVFLVSTAPASNGELKITELDKVSKDEFNAWVKANNYDLSTMYFWYVNKIGSSTVYYIEKDGAVVIKEDWTLYSDNVVDVSTDVPDHAYIDFKLVAHDAATFVDSTGKKHFLNGAFDEITFNFIGAAVDENSLTDTHHAIDTNDYHFGIWGYCSSEDWETIVGFSGNWAGDAKVTTSETNACGIEEFTTEVKDAEATIEAEYRVYGCIVEDVYDAHPVEDGTKCNLVRSVTIDFDKADARIVDIAADPNVIVSNIKIGLPFKATAVVDAATGEAFVDANGDPVTAVDPSSVVINPIQVSFEFKDSAGTKYEFVIEIKQIKYTVEGYTCYDYTGKFISETITPGPGVVIKAATPDLVDKKDSDGKIQIAAIAPYGWVNKTNDIWG